MRKFNYQILVDHGETTNKCTILPLAYREDFSIARYRSGGLHGLNAPLLLHPDGVSLHEVDDAVLSAATGIAAIDCIWRRLAPLVAGLTQSPDLFVRIPPGFQTAYPRRSKISGDPEGGLATIEAIFIAAAFCGVWDESLLREYWFARPFIDINMPIFKRYSVRVPVSSNSRIFQPHRPSHSLERRLARGRPPTPADLAPLF